MLQNLTGWHALVILAVIVLIFGAAKLPALAKSVGQSVRILKKEVATSSEADDRRDDERRDADAGEPATAPPASAAQQPAPIRSAS